MNYTSVDKVVKGVKCLVIAGVGISVGWGVDICAGACNFCADGIILVLDYGSDMSYSNGSLMILVLEKIWVNV